MEEDLFKNLPAEIVLNILSRIPAKSAIVAKCVCVSWLKLMSTDEFVRAHLSMTKSHHGLAVSQQFEPTRLSLFDGHDLHHKPNPGSTFVMDFDESVHESLHSSVNGLIFFKQNTTDSALHVSNPITNDYIKIPPPPRLTFIGHKVFSLSYGFGVTKLSDDYKIVRIFNVETVETRMSYYHYAAQVFSFGTGLWRNLPNIVPFKTGFPECTVFANGNLHWLVRNEEDPFVRISCLDLESEVFTSFFSPTRFMITHLSVLNECLCVCCTSSAGQVHIWLMTEYGNPCSWRQEYLIRRTWFFRASMLFGGPLMVFENGDILLGRDGSLVLVYYSKRDEGIRTVKLVVAEEGKPTFNSKVIKYTPSLLSVKKIASFM